jgi:hypothetical protein
MSSLHQTSGSISSTTGHQPSNSTQLETRQDTTTQDLDQQMATNASQGQEEVAHSQSFENANTLKLDDFPAADENSVATEPQSNFEHPETPMDDNNDDEDDEYSNSSTSDNQAEMAELETRCPPPIKPFFHQYDVVLNIPKNNNPNETVAKLIADVMLVLMGVDRDIILYPFRAEYECNLSVMQRI